MPALSDFTAELVCLGVDALVIALVYKGYSSVRRAAIDVKEAKVLDLDLADSSAVLVASEPGDVVLPYAVVRGRVRPLPGHGDGLRTQFGADAGNAAAAAAKAVVQKVSITEHKKHFSRTGFWHNSQREIHSFVNEVPFGLAPLDNASSEVKVEVSDWSEAIRLDLDVTYDRFESAQSTVGDHVFGFMTGDIPKGVQVTERMLCVDSPMTAVGEVVRAGSRLALRPPSDGQKSMFMVRGTAQSLVKDLDREANIIKWILIAFGSVGLAIGAYAGHKFWRKYKLEESLRESADRLRQVREQRQQHQEQQRRLGGNRAEDDEGGDEETSNACRVCFVNQREVILLECGHICVCADCAAEVMRTRPVCPICRATIVRIAPAYLS